jgi:hypothetical protein
MTARDDKIRRVVAELEVHVAEVEARLAVLKALLADDEVADEEDPQLTHRPRWQHRTNAWMPSFRSLIELSSFVQAKLGGFNLPRAAYDESTIWGPSILLTLC